MFTHVHYHGVILWFNPTSWKLLIEKQYHQCLLKSLFMSSSSLTRANTNVAHSSQCYPHSLLIVKLSQCR
ncbi:hypothetical protein I308_106029 [Cryptococcus tetragattii IND107]|uniref:Uncharacterized protein n=1 Tax=Cryptococcus tetragattii IND107 TaxID=1296105 RepID=A0ABR3BJ84_9TREE